MRSKHQISTYVLIAIFALIGVSSVTALFTSEDIDEVCALDNMTLFRYNGEWMCGSLENVVWTNVTNYTNIYNNYSTLANDSTNLGGVDSSEYLLRDGSVTMTGNQDYDGYNLSNVGNIAGTSPLNVGDGLIVDGNITGNSMELSGIVNISSEVGREYKGLWIDCWNSTDYVTTWNESECPT